MMLPENGCQLGDNFYKTDLLIVFLVLGSNMYRENEPNEKHPANDTEYWG